MDMSEILGPPLKPNKKAQTVMLLQLLMALLDDEKPDDGEMETADEIRAREVPVRPRVEPMGG